MDRIIFFCVIWGEDGCLSGTDRPKEQIQDLLRCEFMWTLKKKILKASKKITCPFEGDASFSVRCALPSCVMNSLIRERTSELQGVKERALTRLICPNLSKARHFFPQVFTVFLFQKK